jgi:hypothetical protein
MTPKPVVTEQISPLTTEELAARWKMHPKSLANWRVSGEGPRYIKLGKRVLYDVADIEAWEQKNKKKSTVS